MPTGQEVAFIRGIMGRSGTNYLRDLLLLHPDCARSRPPVWEDFFLDEGNLLVKYVTAVSSRWPQKWSVPQPATESALLAHLGSGLREFLTEGVDAPVVVAKTPSPIGLEHFDLLFGSSPLLIVVRDGRAVAESAVRSFGWSFERAVRQWASGARCILRFLDTQHAERVRHRIVRYEDLADDVGGETARLYKFLNLDPSLVELTSMESLPVRGSSLPQISFDGAQEDGPHWRPVEKDDSFVRPPAGHGWDEARRARFEWLAGDEMRALGYDLDTRRTGEARARLAQSSRDLAWVSMSALAAARRRFARHVRVQAWGR